MKTLLLNFLKLSLFLTLASSPCYVFGADNPLLLSYPQNKIMGFRGLDTDTSSPNLEDGRAKDLLNVKLSSAYDLKRRYGYSVLGNTLDDYSFNSPAITGLFYAEYSTGTNRVYAFAGNKLKYYSTTTWPNCTGTSTITSDADKQWVCVMALDNAVCTNDSDPPIKINVNTVYTDISFTGMTTPITDAKAVIWFRNYLIWGNTVENSVERPTRFRWSDVGTIQTYDDDNFVDLSSLSGDEIIAFKEMYGDLWIIMRKSIWKASLVGGNDVFVFSKVIDGIGAIAKGSVKIVSYPDNKLGIIFLSEDKIVYLFNSITVLDIGDNISETLNDLTAARLQYAAAEFDGENYYLSAADSGSSTNDIVLIYNTVIQEWTKYNQIDANALARIVDSSIVKTIFGNYDAFVYWLEDPDQVNDVDGVTGIIDDVGTVNTATQTGAQVLYDSDLPADSILTGAIIRITGGTGSAQEEVILTMTGLNATGIVVTNAFSTTPGSTSLYSVGDINAFYETKDYDFGDAPRQKTFLGLYFWAKEDSDNEAIVSYSEDFGSIVGSEIKNLSPSSNSLWDTALWDTGIWGLAGDRFHTVKLKGRGRVISFKFSQPNIDKDFHILGFHMLGERLDIQ